MAATEKKCPHCKKVKSGRHIRFCSKNPDRIKGTPINEVAAQPAQEEATPEIVVESQPTPEEKLPRFEAPPPPKPQQVPLSQAQPGALGQQVQVTSADLFRPVVDVLFNELDKRAQLAEADALGKPIILGRPEPVSEKDRESMSKVYGLLLDKYVPEAVMKTWALEVVAVTLTAAVVIPKILEYRAYAKSLKAGRQRAESNQRVVEAPVSGATFQPPPAPAQSGDVAKDAYERALAAQQAREAALRGERV